MEMRAGEEEKFAEGGKKRRHDAFLHGSSFPNHFLRLPPCQNSKQQKFWASMPNICSTIPVTQSRKVRFILAALIM
jgi:hypothetical protein